MGGMLYIYFIKQQQNKMATRQSGLIYKVMAAVTFSSVTSERLAYSFKVQIEGKAFNKNELMSYAEVFWTICTKKGMLECPFPEYLVKYVLGN